MKNFINKIIKKFSTKSYRRLFLNFFHYGFFQFVRRIIPFIVIPYLLRTIGSEKFGIISIAKAICYYLTVIVRYGFYITGVQMVAKSKSKSIEESEIFSNVITIQSVLAVLVFFIYLIFIFSIKGMREHIYVYLFSYGLVVANIFLALWFYIGRERMEFINFINFLSKVSFLILVFVLVKKQSDLFLVPLIESVTMLLGGIISILLIFTKFRVKYTIPGLEKIKYYLNEGWHIFISNISINLYRSLNIVILGIVASDMAVGLYSAGEKIIKGLQGVFQPITNTLYPRISKMSKYDQPKSIRAVKYLGLIMAIICIAIIISLWIFGKPITIYIKGNYSSAIHNIIRIASFVIFFGVTNYIIGIIFMTNFEMKKEFRNSVLITGILNIIFCTILSYYFQEIGAAVSLVLSEVILLLIMSYYIFTNKEKWSRKANA